MKQTNRFIQYFVISVIGIIGGGSLVLFSKGFTHLRQAPFYYDGI